METGFVVIWRKITEEAFYRKSEYLHVAIHLLLSANHKDNTFVFNKEEITITRGQVLTGRKVLSRETGIGEQIIRNSLDLLVKTGFLTIKTTNKFSIITIQNYDKYQNTTIKTTNRQPTNNQQKTTNNTLNNDTKSIRMAFQPPTPQEVDEYSTQIQAGVSGQHFVDYYTARGWKYKGGIPMKDWKAAVRTWKKGNTTEATDPDRQKKLEAAEKLILSRRPQ